MLLLLLPYVAVGVFAMSTPRANSLEPLASSNMLQLYLHPERTSRRILPNGTILPPPPPPPASTSCARNQLMGPTCVNCDSGSGKSCASCSVAKDKCTSCIKTWLYIKASDSRCDDCDRSCRTCFGSPTNCTACYKGYMLTSANKCLVICNPNEYFVPSNNSCVQCGSFCAACIDNTICVVCKPGYTLDGGNVCKKICPIGFYRLANESLVCVPCHPNCAACTDFRVCTSCTNPLALKSDLDCGVVRGTPDKYLIGYVNGTSTPCDSTCQSCSGTPTNCTTCVRGRYLTGTTCTSNYGSDCFYWSPTNVSCILCRPDQRIVAHYCQPTNLTCPASKYRSVSLDCVSCHPSCLTCDNGGGVLADSPGNCGNCIADYVRVDSTCVPNGDPARSVHGCPNGFQYMETSTLSCVNCESSCAGCSGPSQSQCTHCFAGDILYLGNCVESINKSNLKYNKGSISGDVATSCTASQYWISSSNTCGNCHVSCKTCSGPRDNDCTSCKTLAFLDGYTGKCRCRFLMYIDSSGNCAGCGQYCASCTSPTTCTECLQGYTLNGGVCGDGCLPNQYPTYPWGSTVATCQACDSSCNTCSGGSNTDCSSCYTGKKLDAGVCLSMGSCADASKYFDGASCVACDPSCMTCSNATYCQTCAQNRTMNSGGVCSCQSNQYFDATSSMCKACVAPCATCYVDGNLCNSCSPGYELDGNVCGQISCDIAAVYESGTCRSCHPTCGSCVNTADTGCSVCANNLTQVSGKCACSMSGEYLDTNSYTCEACPSSCTTCTSSTSCTGCQIGYSLVSGICSIQCSPRQYQANVAACGSCDTSCLACSNSGPTSCTSCAPTLTLLQGRCLSPPSHCITAMIAGRDLICQVCESGYQVSDLGQCVLPIACSLPNMIFGGVCVVPIQGKASFNDVSGVFSVVFDREMRLVNNSALVSSLFKVTVLDRSGKTFDSVSVDETKLSADGKALETHLTIGANLINGSLVLEQKDKSQVVLYSSGGYLDPKSIPKTSVTYIADTATASLAAAAGAVSNVAGPVASAALVAATPLSATSGTLLEKVSNFFQFLAVLNGRELYFPQLILDAVGISMLPPIFDNYMQIDEDTVSCQPPSKYVQNQQSCNMLNNYGKELQFIALITVIVSVITAANHLSVKKLKPNSIIRKCLTPIAASFGPAYVVIVFEGSNLEMFGVSLLHLRTAFSSKCQSNSAVAAIVLLMMNLVIIYYAWIFTMDVMPKVPGLAERYSSAQNSCFEADKLLREAKKALVGSKEQINPEVIVRSVKAKQELKAALEHFELECRRCKAGVLAFLLDGYHPNALRRAMYFPLVNLVRNLASQLIVVFLADLGQVQVWLVFIVQTGFTIFRASVRPRRDHAEDYVDILSHAFFALYMGLVAVVNLGVPEQTAQDKFGLVMAAVLVFIALINILFIIFVIGKSIYFLIKEAIELLKKKKKIPLEQESKSISPTDDSVLMPLTVNSRAGKPLSRQAKNSGIVVNKAARSQMKESSNIGMGPSTPLTTLKSMSKKSGMMSTQSTTSKNSMGDTNDSYSTRTSGTKINGISKTSSIKSQTLRTPASKQSPESVLRDRSKEVIMKTSHTVFIPKPKLINVASNRPSESPNRVTTQSKYIHN